MQMLWWMHISQAIRKRVFKLLNARSFKRLGRKSWIISPNSIQNPCNITIGDNVFIANNVVLATDPQSESGPCELVIGDGTLIGHFNHIYATRRVVLGANVLTASGVYISDNLHSYDDVDQPVLAQPIRQLKDTEIGDGSWLGHNVCIYGVRIGRNCVVGANSVVTRDLPDFCVAVGAPARIVRRFDPATGEWRPTSADGAFLPQTGGADDR
jgi:acetyltransferase-like isoleucine patch superfamily enzyme